MADLTQQVLEEFQTRFRAAPLLVQSPGRINLIGEHVDYNLGYVLPGAIDKHFIFAVAVNASGRCRIYSHDFRQLSEFGLAELTAGPHWYNYFMGVLSGFARRGKKLEGVDCVFGGTIPSGGGLSSSAALCGGFAFALNELFQCGLSRLDLALIAQYSEHEFAGVMCGLMDQYASLFGESDRLLLLDCRTNTHEAVPLAAKDCAILLADTRVKHSLASSAYNDRRASCEEGVRLLKSKFPTIESLRDVSSAMLSEGKSMLSVETYKRCHYIVTEMERTQQAARALKVGDIAKVGELMFETHEGLKSEFEVSCPELDVLAATARRHPEFVIGSRMMGGGFGGCTINLVKPGCIPDIQSLLTRDYFTSFRSNPEFYTMTLAQGTHRVKP